jgi:4-aminobutyrate aminotransferase
MERAAAQIGNFLHTGGVFGRRRLFPCSAPAAFLTGLRQLCDKHGILLIFDEVQSGMGRSGEWFASQSSAVTPDIPAVAKGIASGFPLSAVVSRHELMKKWPTWAHGTTFGGNPVSCTSATIATFETIRDEGLLPRCCQLGASTLDRMRLFQKQYPLIADVRGRGLMIGMELTQPDGSPASAICNKILQECLERGQIIINCGSERNIIRFIPPLTISDGELDQTLGIIGEALAAAV